MVTKEELKDIIDKYNRGEDTGYTDEEYDKLLEEYLNKYGEAERPYMRNKQSGAINELVGTLSKVFGVTKPMRDGLKTYDWWCVSKKVNPDAKIIVQNKYDGCSIAYDFITKKFFTRGDYESGESIDVTPLFVDRIDWLDKWRTQMKEYDPVGIKFEAILDTDSYERHCKITNDNGRYKRARDYVAATITSYDIDKAKHISLLGLRGLSADGREFIIPSLKENSMQTTASNYDAIQRFIKDKLDNCAIAEVYDTVDGYEDVCIGKYQIDGVVVSVVDDDGYVIGDEVAIKILNFTKQTKLRDIIWQVGNTGKITPVAILEPVQFDNITVDHVTLSTFSRVMDMDLRHNDTVDIMYNIVPYFIRSYHDGDLRIPIPKTCPSCGHPLDMRVSKNIRCLNPSCTTVKIGGISRYCEKMKMMGISTKTIETLYENGVITSIPSLYEINPTMISVIPGYGDKAETNIINAIWKASENVPIHKWFGALPINDISDKTWKQSFDVLFFDNLACVSNIAKFIKDNDKDTFCELFTRYHIPNVGPSKIRNIVSGLMSNWDLIRETFPYIKFSIESNTTSKGKVAMTGTRDAETQALLKQAGWDIVDFNTKVDMLIIPHEGFTSNKTESAIKHNIPIKTIDEVLQWIKLGGN